MKIKIKLSIMMIAIVLVIAGGIAIIQLNQASTIAKEISIKRVLNLANVRAMYWEGRLGRYLEVLHTLGDVFSAYEEYRRQNGVPNSEERCSLFLMRILILSVCLSSGSQTRLTAWTAGS